MDIVLFDYLHEDAKRIRVNVFIMIQPENPRVFRPWDEWRLV